MMAKTTIAPCSRHQRRIERPDRARCDVMGVSALLWTNLDAIHQVSASPQAETAHLQHDLDWLKALTPGRKVAGAPGPVRGGRSSRVAGILGRSNRLPHESHSHA